LLVAACDNNGKRQHGLIATRISPQSVRHDHATTCCLVGNDPDPKDKESPAMARRLASGFSAAAIREAIGFLNLYVLRRA